MNERNWTTYKLSEKSGIDHEEIVKIALCEHDITLGVAMGLSKALGASAKFWLNLQNQYDKWLKYK
jgi:addiction module HigA family antidote